MDSIFSPSMDVGVLDFGVATLIRASATDTPDGREVEREYGSYDGEDDYIGR